MVLVDGKASKPPGLGQDTLPPSHFTRCHVGRDSFGCGVEEPTGLVLGGDPRGEQCGASPCYRYGVDGRRFQP